MKDTNQIKDFYSEEVQQLILKAEDSIPTEPIIRGKNLILRPMCFEDTEVFLQMRNHPDVSRWFIYRKEITVLEHTDWCCKHLTKNGDSKQFMIYAPQGNGIICNIIGCTNLKNIDYAEKRAEYGLFIADKNVRGKGYGSETVSLMARYAFEQLHLDSIFSRVFTDNIPSVKHLEHEGFTIIKEEKDIEITDGTNGDMYLMELHK